MTVLEKTKSWGRLWANEHSVVDPAFLDEAQAALSEPGLILGFGAGRSYGDVCLNGGGRVLRTQFLDRLIVAHWSTGFVRAEAGLTFDSLLKLAVPRGWFIPVLPGTKFVTLVVLWQTMSTVKITKPQGRSAATCDVLALLDPMARLWSSEMRFKTLNSLLQLLAALA